MKDRRARLRPYENSESYVYGDTGLLSILRATGGMVWPYTPNITTGFQTDYDTISPVHGIQDFNFFTRTKSTTIQCAGVFTAQTQREAVYMLACLHFVRVIGKMDFGEPAGDRAGTPPPTLLFSAYGEYMYNDIPVIVTSVNYDLGADKDYVRIPSSALPQSGSFNFNWDGVQQTGNDTWVPTEVSIAVSMTVQNTPKTVRQKFDLNKFKTGDLLKSGGFI